MYIYYIIFITSTQKTSIPGKRRCRPVNFLFSSCCTARISEKQHVRKKTFSYQFKRAYYYRMTATKENIFITHKLNTITKRLSLFNKVSTFTKTYKLFKVFFHKSYLSIHTCKHSLISISQAAPSLGLSSPDFKNHPFHFILFWRGRFSLLI